MSTPSTTDLTGVVHFVGTRQPGLTAGNDTDLDAGRVPAGLCAITKPSPAVGCGRAKLCPRARVDDRDRGAAGCVVAFHPKLTLLAIPVDVLDPQVGEAVLRRRGNGRLFIHHLDLDREGLRVHLLRHAIVVHGDRHRIVTHLADARRPIELGGAVAVVREGGTLRYGLEIAAQVVAVRILGREDDLERLLGIRRSAADRIQGRRAVDGAHGDRELLRIALLRRAIIGHVDADRMVPHLIEPGRPREFDRTLAGVDEFGACGQAARRELERVAVRIGRRHGDHQKLTCAHHLTPDGIQHRWTIHDVLHHRDGDLLEIAFHRLIVVRHTEGQRMVSDLVGARCPDELGHPAALIGECRPLRRIRHRKAEAIAVGIAGRQHDAERIAGLHRSVPDRSELGRAVDRPNCDRNLLVVRGHRIAVVGYREGDGVVAGLVEARRPAELRCAIAIVGEIATCRQISRREADVIPIRIRRPQRKNQLDSLVRAPIPDGRQRRRAVHVAHRDGESFRVRCGRITVIRDSDGHGVVSVLIEARHPAEARRAVAGDGEIGTSREVCRNQGQRVSVRIRRRDGEGEFLAFARRAVADLDKSRGMIPRTHRDRHLLRIDPDLSRVVHHREGDGVAAGLTRLRNPAEVGRAVAVIGESGARRQVTGRQTQGLNVAGPLRVDIGVGRPDEKRQHAAFVNSPISDRFEDGRRVAEPAPISGPLALLRLVPLGLNDIGLVECPRHVTGLTFNRIATRDRRWPSLLLTPGVDEPAILEFRLGAACREQQREHREACLQVHADVDGSHYAVSRTKVFCARCHHRRRSLQTSFRLLWRASW